LGGFPVDFASDGDVMEDLHVTTDAGISASIERWQLVAAALGGTGRLQRTEADSKIGLLRLGEIRENRQGDADKSQEYDNTCDLFQSNLSDE
jgi:hypothetical protein